MSIKYRLVHQLVGLPPGTLFVRSEIWDGYIPGSKLKGVETPYYLLPLDVVEDPDSNLFQIASGPITGGQLDTLEAMIADGVVGNATRKKVTDYLESLRAQMA